MLQEKETLLWKLYFWALWQGVLFIPHWIISVHLPWRRIKQRMGPQPLGRQVNAESAPADTVIFISYVVSLCSVVPGPHRATLKEAALQKVKFFQHKNYFSKIARGGRDGTVQNFTRNIFHVFENGKRVIKAAPKQHAKRGAPRV